MKEYIQGHYKEDISLKALAGVVFMNASYLSSFFKQKTGKNISDFIQETRMNKALELLIHTDVRVYEIAGLVGYTDPRRFSDAFRRIYGMNPADYKLKLKASFPINQPNIKKQRYYPNT